MGVDSPVYNITANATTDVVTTSVPHGLSLNWSVKILSLTGGTPLQVGTYYYVKTVLSPTTLVLTSIFGGTVTFDITTNVTAGTVSPGWDYQRFYEPHGINGGDPKMVSLVIPENFHLTLISPLINKALLTSLFTTDFDGVARGFNWDIGAFEASVSPPALGSDTQLRCSGSFR